MKGALLVVGAIVRLGTLATFAFLVLKDRGGFAWPLLFLFLATPLAQKPPRPAATQTQASQP